MEAETLYKDSLVKIENRAITFYNYSPFSGKEKTIPIDQIESVQVKKPSLWNGRFRITGTGGFGVWFPADLGRPSRDKIFVAKMKKRWVFHVGFTVENSDAVEEIFKKLGLIKTIK